MKMKLKENQKGFTIIEVLIVLAIAGLIMVIVFLAVPALQRNSRNTQRTNDAAMISSSVNECLTNTNGSVSTCNNGGSYLDTSKIQQLTTAGTASTSGYKINFSQKCNTEGTESAAGGGARSFTVTFQVETSGSDPQNRCIGS